MVGTTNGDQSLVKLDFGQGRTCFWMKGFQASLSSFLPYFDAILIYDRVWVVIHKIRFRQRRIIHIQLVGLITSIERLNLSDFW
jgi:hypothetical protein